MFGEDRGAGEVRSFAPGGLAGGAENVCRSSTPAHKQTHTQHRRRDAPSPSPADVTRTVTTWRRKRSVLSLTCM